MDRLTVISGALFMSANCFAIISLILPDWIVSDVGGNTRLGLLRNCMTIYGRKQLCFAPSLQPGILLLTYLLWPISLYGKNVYISNLYLLIEEGYLLIEEY